MTEILLIIIFALLILNTFMAFRAAGKGNDSFNSEMKSAIDSFSKELFRIENVLKDESARNRDEFNKNAKDSRMELGQSFKEMSSTIIERMNGVTDFQKNNFEVFTNQLNQFVRSFEDRIDRLIATTETNFKDFNSLIIRDAKESREELKSALKMFQDSLKSNVDELKTDLKIKFDDLLKQQNDLIKSNELKLETIRNVLEVKIKVLQEDNSKKLEEMRSVVDEKLQTTIEKRFNESFNLISDRLEQVQRGLGEMQTLAVGVGDLKKVLSNVKTKGVFGEFQLENILEQLLTQNQYKKNVKTKPGSSEHVEFAIVLPGKDDEKKSIWLPIDSKFPTEDYQRLVEAYDNADSNGIIEQRKNLERKILSFAKQIKEKYIEIPHTTDFGIMFLPFESIFAEVLRIPNLFEQTRRDSNIIITGPTTLSAILSSLQMGFRTLAIEKRSGEVWEILGAIKSEFGKFGDILDKTSEQLKKTQNSIDDATKKTRVIERKLKNVQELPAEKAVQLLDSENSEVV